MDRLRRITPSSLAGQIILVVAIALFVAQALNFALLYRERERQLLAIASAPAAARILDAIDRRERFPGRTERISWSTVAPELHGKRRSDIERRARSLLEEAGANVLAIRAV
ncbi:MAG TPA: hypothetical protein VJM81_09875 [Rhizorhapis sp.]|nr:hypothetical protein [Rhizorhapis sp.]